MHADCAFYTGKTHNICQDYARIGKINELPLVVLCDGCSGSPDTDTGSRLLAFSAIKTLKRSPNLLSSNENGNFAHSIINSARVSSDGIGLHPNCLDATLLLAAILNPSSKENEENSDLELHLRMYGDGCVVVKRKTGETEIYNAEFASGAPYYLSYLLDDKRLSAWNDLNNQHEINRYYTKISDLGINAIINPDNSIDGPGGNFYLANDNSFRIGLYLPAIEWVCLTSDGLHTFINKKENTNKQIIDILTEIFDFKSFAGQFVQRRINAFMRNAIKNGLQHEDDFSIAGIYLGDYLNWN